MKIIVTELYKFRRQDLCSFKKRNKSLLLSWSGLKVLLTIVSNAGLPLVCSGRTRKHRILPMEIYPCVMLDKCLCSDGHGPKPLLHSAIAPILYYITVLTTN